MKINITNKEYVTLLEILQIADWMMHAHDLDDTEKHPDFRDLEQKILSLAKGFKAEHLVQYVAKHKEYFATRALESSPNVEHVIDEYDENTFWHELTSRLAQRDLDYNLRAQGIEKLSFDEVIEREQPYVEKYNKEFEEHGIERLQIISAPHATGHN